MTEEKIIEDIMRQAASDEWQQFAKDAIASYRNNPAKQMMELKEQDIMKVLKASYIAERFFGKSRSWLCHKLNHHLINGKPDDFTEAERQQLKDALDTIAAEIQILSDNL